MIDLNNLLEDQIPIDDGIPYRIILNGDNVTENYDSFLEIDNKNDGYTISRGVSVIVSVADLNKSSIKINKFTVYYTDSGSVDITYSNTPLFFNSSVESLDIVIDRIDTGTPSPTSGVGYVIKQTQDTNLYIDHFLEWAISPDVALTRELNYTKLDSNFLFTRGLTYAIRVSPNSSVYGLLSIKSVQVDNTLYTSNLDDYISFSVGPNDSNIIIDVDPTNIYRYLDIKLKNPKDGVEYGFINFIINRDKENNRSIQFTQAVSCIVGETFEVLLDKNELYTISNIEVDGKVMTSGKFDVDTTTSDILIELSYTPDPQPEPPPVIIRPVFILNDYPIRMYKNVLDPYIVTFNVSNSPVSITSVRIDINNILYDVIEVRSDNGIIELPLYSSMFDTIGNYFIQLYPINNSIQGDSVSFNIEVLPFIEISSIVSVKYEPVITGPDFSDYDVPFIIQWESNSYTDYILAFTENGRQFAKLYPIGEITLSISDLLQPTEYTYTNKTFKITLVPFNRNSIEGDPYTFEFEFIIGRVLTKDLAINHIIETYESRLKSIAPSVFSDISKYGTHVANIGSDGEYLITNWVGDVKDINNVSLTDDSLILKLYDPLPTSVDTTAFVTISKLLTNPIVDIVSLRPDSTETYSELRGPNFNINTVYESISTDVTSLLSSNDITNDRLLSEYIATNGIDIKKLDIQYLKDNEIQWSNFVNFSSAVDRVNVLYYKIRLLENLYKQRNALQSSSILVDSIQKITDNIVGSIGTFDGFEHYMYYGRDSLCYPYINDEPVAVDSPEAVQWYNTILHSANEFDYNNPNYIVNHIPAFIHKDQQNSEFLLFLSMIANHFDIFWVYIRRLSERKTQTYTKYGSADVFVYDMLKSFGWDSYNHFSSNNIWEYLFGTNSDGATIYEMPLSAANHEIWRRLLSNLPYILKSKGTKTAVQAVLNCYGIPRDVVSILEFGHTNTEGKYKQTIERISAALGLDNGSISVNWNDVSFNATTQKPQTILIRHRVDHNSPIVDVLTKSSFKVQYYKVSETHHRYIVILGTPDLLISPFGSYVLDSNNVPTRLDADPNNHIFTTDDIASNADFDALFVSCEIMGTSSVYMIKNYKYDGSMVYSYTSNEYIANETYWSIGSTFNIGPSYSGLIDSLKVYKSILNESVTRIHASYPDSIQGNTDVAYKDDLMLYVPFEFIFNVTNGSTLQNLAISNEYNTPHITVNSIQSATEYPYQFSVYDSVQQAVVSYNVHTTFDKVRIEDTNLISDLSHERRSTLKSYDNSLVDSPKLGFVVSPAYHLNLDISRTIGAFNLGDYIGDPSDMYKSEYRSLSNLRDVYFDDNSNSFNYYFTYIKYVNKLLFETLLKLVPLRSKVSYGILIEPHILERSKVKKHKPTSNFADGGTSSILVGVETNAVTHGTLRFDVDTKQYAITSHTNDYESFIDTTDAVVDFNYDTFGTDVDISDVYILSTNATYNTNLDQLDPSISSDALSIGDLVVDIKSRSERCASKYVTYAGFTDDVISNIFPINGYSWIYKLNYNGSISYNLYVVLKIKIKNVIRKYVVNNIYSYPYDFVDIDEIIDVISIVPIIGNDFYFADLTDDDGNVIVDEFNRVVYESLINSTVIDYILSNTQNSIVGVFNGCHYISKNEILGIELVNGYSKNHHKYISGYSEGMRRSFYKGSVQDKTTTPDGLPAVEVFATNPNSLKVTESYRGSGKPILKIS